MKLLLPTLFILSSCMQFVSLTQDNLSDQVKMNQVNILFSNNINGETHPCGCRNFPLGGLPQANGIIQNFNNQTASIYVDAGDTFFESTIVPEQLIKSQSFKANKIAEGLSKMGLKMMTPGDQDFALGESFLIDIAKKVNFKFLISNASSLMKLPHEKEIVLKIKDHSFIFIGITDPKLLKNTDAQLFVNSRDALSKILPQLTKKYPNKNRRIILISHSGLAADEKLAKEFQQIDWIIGSHTQSFLRKAYRFDNTNVVQALSRNHYIGQINVKLGMSNTKDEYEIHQTLDQTKDLIKNNPMISWLDQYKSEFDKILLSEQAPELNTEGARIPTYISCSECHDKQVEFWQKTAHSLAYTTLIHAKSQNNLSCVKCHSVGLGDAKGFNSSKNMIQSDKKDFNFDDYWKEFGEKFKIKHPIRKLAQSERLKLSQEWIKFDSKHKVTANHTNVQCLNCHTQNAEHPFSDTITLSKADYQAKCIECHTGDQSPEWYNKDDKGLATSLNDQYFSQKLKEVSCPKIER